MLGRNDNIHDELVATCEDHAGLLPFPVARERWLPGSLGLAMANVLEPDWDEE